MKIEHSSLNFKSINHPIKPFQLKTNNGKLLFTEIKFNKEINPNLLQEIGSFFLDNFAAQSSHPFWKKCRKNHIEYDATTYQNYINGNLIEPIKNLIGNPDATMLIGCKNKDKIAAAIVVDPLNIDESIKNDKTLYLDLIAVDKNYRKNNVGRNLIEKIFETTKGRYEDCLLVAYNESVPFYKKLGFKNLPQNNNITENLAKHRIDYPEYASFLIKKL